MKRILIGKILGLMAAILLVVNLLFPNFIAPKRNSSHTKKEITKNHSYKSVDDSLIQFVNEGAEEDFEEDVEENSYQFLANFASGDFLSHERVISAHSKVQLQKYNLVEIKKQSIPRWLLVRHILI